MNQSMVAMGLVVVAGCALADVYKWTDANGEVHYGDFPTRPNAEKVLTQGQIQQEENAEKATQPPQPVNSPTDDNQQLLDDIQHRRDECQRYRSLMNDRLLRAETPIPFGYNRYGYGYGLGNRYGRSNANADLTGVGEIEANIKKYCLD